MMRRMKTPESRIKLARMDPKQVADEIGDFIVRKVLEMKKTGGVLGLSGGVDSTCVAALTKRAFDRHNAKHPGQPLEVVGFILPSHTNNPKDEDYGVAYYTLFGDGAVHMSPIGNLPKRLVREMAAYLGFEDLSERVSTAGLEPGQTSFKDLGCDYEFAELVLNGLDQGLKGEELAVHSQVVAYAREQMDKYAQWYGTPKFTSAAALVTEIIQRHEIALLKAEIVNPDIAPITLALE